MLFSDKYRWVKITGILVLLLSLLIYSHIVGPSIVPEIARLDKYSQNPSKFDGQMLAFTFDKVEAVMDDGFQLLADGNKTIFIKGGIEEVKKGDVVSVRLSFHKNGDLTIKELHIHKGEIWRKIVSIPVLLVVLILFFLKYKFEPKRLIFTERK